MAWNLIGLKINVYQEMNQFLIFGKMRAFSISKKKFEYKDSWRIKQWWIRKQGTLKKLIEKEISLKPKGIYVILFLIENANIDCLIEFYFKIKQSDSISCSDSNDFQRNLKNFESNIVVRSCNANIVHFNYLNWFKKFKRGDSVSCSDSIDFQGNLKNFESNISIVFEIVLTLTVCANF